MAPNKLKYKAKICMWKAFQVSLLSNMQVMLIIWFDLFIMLLPKRTTKEISQLKIKSYYTYIAKILTSKHLKSKLPLNVHSVIGK